MTQKIQSIEAYLVDYLFLRDTVFHALLDVFSHFEKSTSVVELGAQPGREKLTQDTDNILALPYLRLHRGFSLL